MLESNQVYHGDCLEVMNQIDDNCVDSIVTDPPYGLRFMGKKWDYDIPSIEIWQECLRILKPGGHLLSFAGSRTQHRIAVNIEDGGFEIRDCIMWIYGCLSDDTEILTDKGWKNYKTISIKDDVYSFQNGKIVKNNVKDIYKYHVENEEMVLVENHNTSQLLTKNHKMLIKECKRKQIKGIRTSQYENFFKYVIANNRPYQYKMPLSGIYDGNYSIGEDFAELIGWIISEGHYQRDTNAINIYQSSVNFEKVNRIKYILDKCEIKHSEYKRDREYKNRNYIEHQFYISGDIVNKIKNIIPDKKLNIELLDLPYEEKERLIVGLCEGDGSKNKNGNYSAFYQKDIKQLELFQILLHFTNKQGWLNKKKYSCSIHYNPLTEIQGKHKKQHVNYSGIVWCIKTEIGNFMAKRNGKIFITGNSGFPKSLDISKKIDQLKGEDRKVIGKGNDKGRTKMFGGNNTRDTFITKPSSPEAIQWDGWGTNLKPAYEPIYLCRKPISEKTIAKNVLKWGVGGINIDACRIKYAINETPESVNKNSGKHGGIFGTGKPTKIETKGRWPVNVIHDGSDEVVELFPYTKSGGGNKSSRNYKGLYKGLGNDYDYLCESSEGSAARFFYCAKATKKERGESNNHPTVKPLKLIEYLIKLITPQNGIVLDCFAGSGTTGVAARNLNRNFILIEKELEYVELIKDRLNEPMQTKLT